MATKNLRPQRAYDTAHPNVASLRPLVPREDCLRRLEMLQRPDVSRCAQFPHVDSHGTAGWVTALTHFGGCVH